MYRAIDVGALPLDGQGYFFQDNRQGVVAGDHFEDFVAVLLQKLDFLALGNIVQRPGNPDHFAIVAKGAPGHQLHPALAAIPGNQAHFEAIVVNFTPGERPEFLDAPLPVFLVDIGQKRFAKRFFDRIAEQVGPGRIEESPDPRFIGLENYFLDAADDLAVFFFALAEIFEQVGVTDSHADLVAEQGQQVKIFLAEQGVALRLDRQDTHHLAVPPLERDNNGLGYPGDSPEKIFIFGGVADKIACPGADDPPGNPAIYRDTFQQAVVAYHRLQDQVVAVAQVDTDQFVTESLANLADDGLENFFEPDTGIDDLGHLLDRC